MLNHSKRFHSSVARMVYFLPLEVPIVLFCMDNHVCTLKTGSLIVTSKPVPADECAERNIKSLLLLEHILLCYT
jgi:hypothetical protein